MTVTTALWLLAGLGAVLPLLIHAARLTPAENLKVLGIGLVIAAAIYIIFAVIQGQTIWILIEVSGTGIFGMFWVLARRHSPLWLVLGWLLHPLWDGILHAHGPGSAVAPAWYAVPCISFDLAVAIYLFIRVRRTWSRHGLTS